MLQAHPKDWRSKLKRLKSVDWSRRNSEVWEGRATVAGKVSKATAQVVLVTNVVKKALGLELTPEEQRAEDAHQGLKNG